ncbi:MAG: nucleotidyltransferase domain-containing protein [Polyangiales bacterium]
MDLDLDRLADELCAKHHAHTVVLYGSRARGTPRRSSDVDVFVLRDEGPATSDHRRWEGLWLDAWIHPVADAEHPEEGLLRLCGGRVLRQRDGLGDALLARVEAMRDAGPPPLTEEKRALCATWLEKTAARVREASPYDLEAGLRRAALLNEALESYFVLRSRWYPGPRAALSWLAAGDAETHACFAAALRDLRADLDPLVRRVIPARDGA